MSPGTKVQITNVNGSLKNKWVGQVGTAINALIYPGVDDYMIEVRIRDKGLLFKLSEIKIVRN